MVQVTIKHDIEDAVRMLNSKVRRQLPFATSKALNETAKLVQAEVKQELTNRFDRVTPYVVNSVFMKYAKKADLRAEIYIRDRAGAKKASSLADTIAQQFQGGMRIRTGLENALTKARLINSNEYVAVGAGATLNSYGNMSRSQIKQLLSQLLNPNMNASKRAGAIFWANGKSLPRGAWMRKGKEVKPLLIVVSKPSYKQKIDMNKIALRIVERDFDKIFRREFEEAIRTAR